MNTTKKIKSALISVFHKDGLDEILSYLNKNDVKFISTGGTADFIEKQGYAVTRVEELTGYPSILGGRVKTLHPAVFGGILTRRDNEQDRSQCEQYNINDIDLVIVDLYPFEDTVASGASDEDIIEKIDIGGISLIRGAAKNFNDVVIVASNKEYSPLLEILKEQGAETTLEQRRYFATRAFAVSSGYDSAIYNWFAGDEPEYLRLAVNGRKSLRYGENPHQSAAFFGNLDEVLEQLHGKEISYNNLLDINAACALIAEFEKPTFAVIKHNNACGIASRDNAAEAWKAALACDPVSAFGGIIVTNRPVTEEIAASMADIFFEVIIAPDYEPTAYDLLTFKKKNRIIIRQKEALRQEKTIRTAVNGVLVQQTDNHRETEQDLKIATNRQPSEQEKADMLFANILVKHCKSNSIVLAKDDTLLAAGVGQTSRVDSLKQAIEKAHSFGFNLEGATMASDAFFPFADCVEIADKAGITSVIHPGGSIRDQESIDYCNQHNMTMAITGYRHFRH